MQSRWRVARTNLARGAHAALRFAQWAREPDAFPSPRLARAGLDDHALSSIEVPLAGVGAREDDPLERGKRLNVMLAATRFDGVHVSHDRPLSFWRTLGRVTRARGYADGREIILGCVVPTVGGGLCLLSNALFRAALEAGWEILERHAHSTVADGGTGLDATVAYPHIDLRFAPRTGHGRVSVRVDAHTLRVTLFGDAPAAGTPRALRVVREDARAIGRATLVTERIEASAAHDDAPSWHVVATQRRRVVDSSALARSCLDCSAVGCARRAAGHRRP